MNSKDRAHAQKLAKVPGEVAHAFLDDEEGTPALALVGYVQRYEKALQAAEKRAKQEFDIATGYHKRAESLQEKLQAAEERERASREALGEILDLAERWHTPEDQRLSRVRIRAREVLSDTTDGVEGES